MELSCYALDEWEEEDCYLVRATSKGTIDGVPCTTTITGNITVLVWQYKDSTEEGKPGQTLTALT